MTINDTSLLDANIKNSATININDDYTINLGKSVSADTKNPTNNFNISTSNLTVTGKIENQIINLNNSTFKVNAGGEVKNSDITMNGTSTIDIKNNTIDTLSVDNFVIKDTASTTNTAISFDTDFQGAKTSDLFNVGTFTNNGNISLKIDSISILNDMVGGEQEIELFKSETGLSGLQIQTARVSTSGDFGYKFVQKSGVGNEGILIVSKTNPCSLAEAIGTYGANNNISNYILFSNDNFYENLGTLARKTDAPEEQRTFTINGMGYSLNGENLYDGVTVNSDDMLTLKDLSSIKNANYVVKNNGITVVNGVNFENNTLDIENNNDLRFNTANSNLSSGISGTGTTTIDGVSLGVNDNTKITQNNLNMKNASSLTMSPTNINISDEINIEDKNSTLTYTTGTNNNKITGEGTVVINGNVTNNAEISDNTTSVTQNSTLVNNSTIIGSVHNKGTITGNGELKLTGNSTTETGIDNTIYLTFDDDNNQKATLTVGNSSGNNITLNKDILSDNSENTVTFTGSSNIDFKGKFDPASAEVAMDSMDAVVMVSL